jgi:hypothetical protein
MSFHMIKRAYIPCPYDKLGLSVPYARCDVCKRLYACFTDVEVEARDCGCRKSVAPSESKP